MLAEHGLKPLELVSSYAQAKSAARRARCRWRWSRWSTASRPTTSPCSASRTFSATGWCARASASGAPQDVLAEASALTAGDLVVHIDHGVGRFVGLKTIEAAGAPHDCLEIHYAGGDRLFLPVENLELLSRYGSETRANSTGSARPAGRRARRG